jgi:uncharacterized protein
VTTPFQQYVARSERLAAGPAVLETGGPMRDGIELAANVYLPAEPLLPAPAIVEVTPYDKQNPLLVVPEAGFYQRNGYAFVAADARGRGKSEGDWVALVNDGADTYDVIEWAAAQDWCDGRIGTTGLSYMGWVQWAAAAERPPHLRCMVSTSAAGRWQQEIPYTNGVFQLFFAWPASGRPAHSAAPPPSATRGRRAHADAATESTAKHCTEQTRTGHGDRCTRRECA